MSKTAANAKSKSQSSAVPGFQFVQEAGGLAEYQLKRNGLRVLHTQLPGTGVITSNITYHVGSRDEARGETGLAHMLEHMLFKPTVADRKQGIDSGAMQLERESGCVINANTWRDRTNYYFSYPVEYLDRALDVEADRMQNLTLQEADFLPEQGNVLSEFDMYFGDPEFALSVAMNGAAFFSHPYSHEVIGFREDIEQYTLEKLQAFYEAYYRPDNATLIIAGDITRTGALKAAKRHFGHIKRPDATIPRYHITEPTPEGERRVRIKRPSSTNLLALGVRHDAFPGQHWHETWLALATLCAGPESILQKLLVDSGVASSVSFLLEPSKDPNLATIFITISPGYTHRTVEQQVRDRINTLTTADIRSLVKKIVAHELTDQAFLRTSSLKLVDELTEFVSAGDWAAFTKTTETISHITPKQVHARINDLFTPQTMVVGEFVGTTNSNKGA